MNLTTVHLTPTAAVYVCYKYADSGHGSIISQAVAQQQEIQAPCG